MKLRIKKLLPLILIAVVVIATGCTESADNQNTVTLTSTGNSALEPLKEKVYVALEGDGKVSVIDPKTNQVYGEIDLTKTDGSFYAAHNVQVAPGGKSVWVTAIASEGSEGEDEHGGGEDMEGMKMDSPDEVVVIDPATDEIIERIPVASGAHLAHVVITPDENYAYVTAQEEGAIYKINAKTYQIEETIPAPPESEPHGLRVTPDGKTVYIALLGGKAVGILDTASSSLEQIDVEGAAVQTGITTDGKYMVVSLFDTKKLGVLEISTGKVSYIDLPPDSKGPIQMYPVKNSSVVYLADQGYYFDQPTGDNVYKIDLEKMQVISTIKTGEGPHGVVVSQDGRYVYVTNIVSNDVSVIDAANDQVVARISTGKQPNGISMWSENMGGTP